MLAAIVATRSTTTRFSRSRAICSHTRSSATHRTARSRARPASMPRICRRGSRRSPRCRPPRSRRRGWRRFRRTRPRRGSRRAGRRAGRGGRHELPTTRLYDAALLASFDRMLLADGARLRYLNLVPDPRERPHSSLGHMMGVVARERGDGAAAGTCAATRSTPTRSCATPRARPRRRRGVRRDDRVRARRAARRARGARRGARAARRLADHGDGRLQRPHARRRPRDAVRAGVGSGSACPSTRSSRSTG